MNFSADKIRKGMVGPLTGKMRQAGVAADQADDVAGKLFDEALGRIRAELVARGGVNAGTAGQLLRERVGKAEAKQGAAAQRAGKQADLGAVSQEIMMRSGGMASPEQALHGAEQYQSLIRRGVAPAIAADRVMAELARLLMQQEQCMQQQNDMMGGMMGMIMQANARMGVFGAQQGMMHGQMRKQHTQKPMPWNTVPPGAP